jgi:hypothetical protein
MNVYGAPSDKTACLVSTSWKLSQYVSGFEHRCRQEFPPIQTSPDTHPASCTMDTGSLIRGKSAQGVRCPPTPDGAKVSATPSSILTCYCTAFTFAALSNYIYRMIKNSLCTWWLQYKKLTGMFKLFPAVYRHLLTRRTVFSKTVFSIAPSTYRIYSMMAIFKSSIVLGLFEYTECLHCNNQVHRDFLITLNYCSNTRRPN